MAAFSIIVGFVILSARVQIIVVVAWVAIPSFIILIIIGDVLILALKVRVDILSQITIDIIVVVLVIIIGVIIIIIAKVKFVVFVKFPNHFKVFMENQKVRFLIPNSNWESNRKQIYPNADSRWIQA